MNGKTFTLSVDSSGDVVTIRNPSDSSSCWSSGSGWWDPESNTIVGVICKGCTYLPETG